MVEFNKSSLAAAVGAVAAAGLAAPANAVVVVGGDNGWEISFDGNINAFYTIGDYDDDYVLNPVLATGQQQDTSRITSGFLPAFFSFNAKSPTVNGLTGTARISFAPTINTDQDKTQQFQNAPGGNGNPGGLQGASLDTREVLANISGSFGEISFGRTLSLFGRQAILNDMVLFGVGFEPGPTNFGSVTFGGVGHGYTYPEFAARIQYTTPNINGFQAAFGLYDPSRIEAISFGLGGAAGVLDETSAPRFEGELSYATNFTGGMVKVWADGLYQNVDSTNANGPELDVYGIGAGATITFSGFNLTGYYYDGEGLGLTQQFNAFSIGTNAVTGALEEADADGFYVQGTYTFNGKTKVGVRYGESKVEGNGIAGLGAIPTVGAASVANEVELDMLSVGVYHDVTSWLKVIAEYNRMGGEISTVSGRVADLNANGQADDEKANIFSIGSFLFW